MKYPFKTIIKKSKGFTLIETMVAIFILTLVIAIAMGGIQKSLQTSSYSRDQITAYYLAEEAIEYVRAVRDSNVKAGDDWLTKIDQCVDGGIKCTVDSVNGDTDTTYRGLTPCSGASCTLKFYQPGSQAGKFSHGSTGTNSKFSRYITIDKSTSALIGGNEIKVIATVTWNPGPFGMQTYVVTEQLFNTK